MQHLFILKRIDTCLQMCVCNAYCVLIAKLAHTVFYVDPKSIIYKKIYLILYFFSNFFRKISIKLKMIHNYPAIKISAVGEE